MEEEQQEEKKQSKPRAKYVGKGKFLNGVPARDLNAEEWASFSSQERKYFVSLGLFEVIND